VDDETKSGRGRETGLPPGEEQSPPGGDLPAPAPAGVDGRLHGEPRVPCRPRRRPVARRLPQTATEISGHASRRQGVQNECCQGAFFGPRLCLLSFTPGWTSLLHPSAREDDQRFRSHRLLRSGGATSRQHSGAVVHFIVLRLSWCDLDSIPLPNPFVPKGAHRSCE
jgi:hypothetical protein